ncbi:MAG: hypothetical protein H6R14_2536 [Proteobacteria bacterium]|nr:hypothetical protein [Pseudomonadota bacterium]
MKIKFASLLASLLISAGAQASTQILTFDANAACGSSVCSDYNGLSQSYGDIANSIDVSYIDVNTPNAGLYWWNFNYNDLVGVAWAGGGDASSHARIEIKSLGGGNVTLNSFDLGAYANTTRGTHVRVTTIGGANTLFSFDGNVGLGATQHNTFTPNVTAQGGLWIEWSNSAYNVGIDNISYTAAVPEPESYAMFLLGLGVVGAVARRKAVASK